MGWLIILFIWCLPIIILLAMFIAGVVFLIRGIVRCNKAQKAVPPQRPNYTCVVIGSILLLFSLSCVFSILSHSIRTDNSNALWKVVENNDYKKADELLQNGADPDIMGCNNRNNYGYYLDDVVEKPPLYYAIKNGNYEMTELLLQYGADPNLHDKYDLWSPLYTAIYFDRYDIMQLLINYGADVGGCDGTDDEPYLICAIYDCDADAAEILLKNSADPNTENKDGRSALDLSKSRAQASWLTPRERAECTEITRLLEYSGEYMN